MIKSVGAILLARLREFYRDRASLSWNFIFPFFIIIAFYFIFTDEGQIQYRVGVVGTQATVESSDNEFLKTKYIQFMPMELEKGMQSVRRQRIDMLVDVSTPDETQYWVNSDSPKAFFLERILKGTVVKAVKNILEGKFLSYVDWVIPGILAMNMMFNCLWGVGWVVVKYRQEGFLKRLNATPLKAYQFLLAQVGARFIINFFVTLIVFIGAKSLVGFEMNGSYLSLFIVYIVGVAALISIGLAVACRTTSKEFADGILNLLSWPMMILSEVWFSLEGSNSAVITVSELLPLTHFVKASRAIINDGASLYEVSHHVLILVVMTFVLLAVTSFFFKWTEE